MVGEVWKVNCVVLGVITTEPENADPSDIVTDTVATCVPDAELSGIPAAGGVNETDTGTGAGGGGGGGGGGGTATVKVVRAITVKPLLI
jgi:hypothetical protein